MLKDPSLTAMAIKKRQKEKAAKKKFGQVSTMKKNYDDEERQGLEKYSIYNLINLFILILMFYYFLKFVISIVKLPSNSL